MSHRLHARREPFHSQCAHKRERVIHGFFVYLLIIPIFKQNSYGIFELKVPSILIKIESFLQDSRLDEKCVSYLIKQLKEEWLK